MRLLEENTGSVLFDISFNNYLSSGKGNKSKYKQMGLHQTKNLLHCEESYQQNQKSIY